MKRLHINVNIETVKILALFSERKKKNDKNEYLLG